MSPVQRFLTLWLPLFLISACNVAAQPAREDHVFVTLAGSSSMGSTDGSGPIARFHLGFSARSGIASAGGGVVYVADTKNHLIRRILPTGEVSTVAGYAGVPGIANGTGSGVRFNGPTGIAVDADGNLWVADTGNRALRKLDSKGVVTTVPGSFFSSGVAVGPSGTVYVSDFAAGSVSKLDPDGSVREVLNGFAGPTAIAVDADETLYVAEANANVISRTTLAKDYSILAGERSSHGFDDGVGSAARFFWITGLSLDRATGTLYAIDEFAHTLRQVTRTGVVTTLAGLAGNPGNADGFRNAARLNYPQAVAVDTQGIYITDSGNNIIRRVAPSGDVTTLAGQRLDADGTPADGVGTSARFADPVSLSIDRRGTLYLVDKGALRKITPEGQSTTLPGNYGHGLAVDSSDRLYYITPEGLFRRVDGEAPRLLSSKVSMSDSITVNTNGVVFVAKRFFSPIIQRLDSDGSLVTIAGSPTEAGAANGPGLQARFGYPSAIAADSSGNLYVTEGTEYRFVGTTLEGSGFHMLRKISREGVVSTVPLGVQLIDPQGVAVDGGGNVYIADTGASVILKLSVDGRVRTIGGHQGGPGYADGLGDQVVFGYPKGLAIGGDGTVYVAEGLSRSLYPVDRTVESRIIRKGWLATTTIPLTTGTPVRFGSRFGFTVIGTQKEAVVIETTGDLLHWSPIQTNAQGGVFTFVDPRETGSQPRYYRARSD